MFSSGCASCCYKQGQGWTQGEEATVMSIENMEMYLHPGWCRQCKEYLLFVFSITVIAKAFVVLYVIRLNLRVRVRFDLKSALR